MRTGRSRSSTSAEMNLRRRLRGRGPWHGVSPLGAGDVLAGIGARLRPSRSLDRGVGRRLPDLRERAAEIAARVPEFALRARDVLPRQSGEGGGYARARQSYIVKTTLSQTWSGNSILGPQCAFEMSMFMCPAVHTLTRN